MLNGNGGIDTLYGGDGNDTMTGGGGGLSGGAPDILKLVSTVNASITTALSIEGGFDLLTRGDVASSSTIPHATVVATSHGGIEFYAFTVASGATVTFDIDDASFDSTLRILRSDGSQVAENDDAGADSAHTDSQLSYTFQNGGTYYIQVAQWATNTDTSFTTEAPPRGATYTLHVSVPGHAAVPLTTVGSTVYGEGGNDVLNGGSGHDALYGGDGDDILNEGPGSIDGGAGSLLDGGAGDDTIRLSFGSTTVYGGSGNDLIHLSFGNSVIDGGAGTDTVLIGSDRQSFNLSTSNGVTIVTAGTSVYQLTNVEQIQFRDQILILGGNTSGTSGDDVLTGSAGADVISGLGGNDVITPGAGSDTVDGGAGIDTLVLSGPASSYYFEATSAGYRVFDGLADVDTIINIEQIKFGGGPNISLASAASTSFDPYRYMASYTDLATVFGKDPSAAYRHYISNGMAEGRSAVAFDTLRYIASNPDLTVAFGTNERAGSQHFIQSGSGEHRATVSFDPLRYVASNPDLILAFGTNQFFATAHYITNGFAESRSLTTFDALIYGASNPDLARGYANDASALTLHYITSGFSEQRSTTGFDALRYIASNPDLARGYGIDPQAGLNHYLTAGADEGRQTDSFDPRLYAASANDLARALGADARAAEQHYIIHGLAEGRETSGFDAVGYLLTYHDLAGITADQALDHWLSNGADEGRLGDLAFGREQNAHQLGAGIVSDAIDALGDFDWFQINVGANQTMTLNVNGAGLGVGTLDDAVMAVYDSLGRTVAFDNDSGPGLDAQVTFTSTGGGLYYLVVGGQGSSAGSYQVTATGGPGVILAMSEEKPVAEGASHISGVMHAPLVSPMGDHLYALPDEDPFIADMLLDQSLVVKDASLVVGASATWDIWDPQPLAPSIDATMSVESANPLFASEAALMLDQTGHHFFKFWDHDSHWGL